MLRQRVENVWPVLEAAAVDKSDRTFAIRKSGQARNQIIGRKTSHWIGDRIRRRCQCACIIVVEKIDDERTIA